MANIPDLMTLLCLDSKMSTSPFGGHHRTILISKHYTNSSDFAFNNFLHHFARKEPNTPLLLVTISHDWINYSASAAKCGYNLRRASNNGNIEVLNVMAAYLNAIKSGDQRFNLCEYVKKNVLSFIREHSNVPQSTKEGVISMKPLIIMIDDISLLLSLNSDPNEVYKLYSFIDMALRKRSQNLTDGRLSHFIVQTMLKKYASAHKSQNTEAYDLNYLVANMENISDLYLSLKPLDTGYSTRVDGTVKIVDNRLPNLNSPGAQLLPSITLMVEGVGEVGTKRAFFFKLGDRRVRLTSTALIL